MNHTAQSTRPLHFSLITATVCCALVLPLFTLILQSVLLNPLGSNSNQWTLQWYALLSTKPAILNAAALSLVIAVTSATITTAIATCAAIAMSRSRSRWLPIVQTLTFIPLVLPELVLGIASVIWFGVIGLTLGMTAVMIGHITFSLAYVVATMMARLASEDISLEEAARDLGAGSWQVLTKVILPRIKPAILAGWLMAFTVSFDDFLITFFTSAAGQDTLPLKLYALIRFGVGREIYALASLLIVLTIITMLGAAYLRRKD